MNDQSSKRKDGKERISGSGKTTMFVLVIRGRPVYDNCHPSLKDKSKRIKG